jgi:prephenate dehydratase
MPSTTESTVTVAYPGREGAHSAAAADTLFGGGEELRALPSFQAVADAVAGSDVDFGVLPIESSLSGPVAETHDLLYASPLSIVEEVVLPIRHCLLAPADVALEEIRLVHSHPVALDQCRQLLARMPNAQAVAAPTTADAANAVAEKGDPTEAAIASERAAHLDGLHVVAADVGDHPEAYTRFVAVATYTRLDRNGHAFRTAFSFVTDHTPGSLLRALEPFDRLGVNLVQLVSRPIPDSPWRYRFDAVLDGHPLDAAVGDALREVRSTARRLTVFGCYPAGALSPTPLKNV